MNQVICRAISEKRFLSFIYEGHPRVVEPHRYGITTAGHEAIRCYQVLGGGAGPAGSPWDLMILSKITALTLSKEIFKKPRKGYKRGDKDMIIIFGEL